MGGRIAVSRVHVGKLRANGKPLVSLEYDNQPIDVPCCLALDGCSVAEVYVLAEAAASLLVGVQPTLGWCYTRALAG